MEKTHQTQIPRAATEHQGATLAAQVGDASHAHLQPNLLLQAAQRGAPQPAAIRLLAPTQQHQAILGLQRFVGNAAVQRLLGQRRPATGSLTKAVGREEELAKATTTAPDDATVDVEQMGPDQVATAEQGGDRTVGLSADHGLLAKASTTVRAGARPSRSLRSNYYGLTYPERVEVAITARLDQKAGTWSPKVTRLTGHYSMQTRLLPGQAEITGPGGNTTKSNFCAQAANLKSLGNKRGNKWYMINAVIQHEKVHAKRLLPALRAAATTRTTDIERITIRHVAKMTRAQAIAKLQADATYIRRVTILEGLWYAEFLIKVAGDHAAGGPTDKTEQKVTEPMLKKICDHAKRKKWGACAACR